MTSEKNQKQYKSPPEMALKDGVSYQANVKMKNGEIFTIQLHAEKSPETVNSFVFLAREGYFDDVTFHRVLDGFMAQGGDPTGTGSGGPGYQFDNEDSDLVFDQAGVVAMANAGRDTNGSQFFITYTATPHLDNKHAVFGRVIEGMDNLKAISPRDPRRARQAGDAIKTIRIEEK